MRTRDPQRHTMSHVMGLMPLQTLPDNKELKGFAFTLNTDLHNSTIKVRG